MNDKTRLDNNVAEYLAPTPDRVVDQKIMAMVCEFLIDKLEGKQVLEMGVGDQVMTPMLVSRYPAVTTIDGSQQLLDAMRRRLVVESKAWTGVCTLFEEYVPERKFDLVFCTYVLEHVDNVSAVLRHAKLHWLQPGGRIAIVVPHALSLHRRLARVMGMIKCLNDLGKTDARMDHRRCMTCFDLEQEIACAGLHVDDKAGLFCKPLPNKDLCHLTEQQLQGLFTLGRELPIEYAAAIYYLAVKSD